MKRSEHSAVQSTLWVWRALMCVLADQSAEIRQPKKIDDTGTHYDLLDRSRTVWPSSPI